MRYPAPRSVWCSSTLSRSSAAGSIRSGTMQVAVGPPVRPPHPAPQLVELRQAEPVGVVDDHRVGVGDVEPRFDDHRRHQDVDLAGDEPLHHRLELVGRHLAVAERHPGARRQRAGARGNRRDRLDPVVHEEHLAAAVEFARDRLVEQAVVPRLDEGEDRRAVPRRRLDDASCRAGRRATCGACAGSASRSASARRPRAGAA